MRDYKHIINCVVGFSLGFSLGFILREHIASRELLDAYNLCGKNKYLYRTAIQYINIERKGTGIIRRLEEKGYYSIAVYGLSHLGKCLVDQLKDSTNVLYGVDGGTVSFRYDIPIYAPADDLPEVDAIIVTPVFSYEDIRRSLEKKVTCPILSFADIVFE